MNYGGVLIALLHDFILITNQKLEEISLSGIFDYRDNNPDHVVQLHDDLFGYMLDSLKWIETVNPSNNEIELGFNYYGHSIIHRSGIVKFLKLMQGWVLIFSEAPEELILTGWYTWNEDSDPRTTGKYEKLSFKRDEVLNTISKLIHLINKAMDDKHIIIYAGI